MSEALSPGLMVIHGNHPEALRDLLVAWMARYPLAPLESETILVQSNGIAQWLKLALGRDVADGGCGITAALDVQSEALFAGLMKAHREKGGIVIAATHQDLGLEGAQGLAMKGFEFGEVAE